MPTRNSPKKVHRPVIAFFISRDPNTLDTKFERNCFFLQEGRSFYRSMARTTDMDLRGYFPRVVEGEITTMEFNPEYDEVDSDSERDGIDEFISQPIGPWCFRMPCVPFADEAVVPEYSLPVQFAPRFVSTTDFKIPGLVQRYLDENLNKLSQSPTVGEFVFGICKVIADYFRTVETSSIDGTGVFVSFRGVMNVHDSSPNFLGIDISVEDSCTWVEGQDNGGKDVSNFDQ
ncbi:hypothetical protein TWF481_006542 [Arthrobotrys musiformis]|uniref:Uncharacterized protein n=1 Tax=Arthrobotrys musiformis TaxID=47236 RepID=A0AAV9WAI6_9PEZI